MSKGEQEMAKDGESGTEDPYSSIGEDPEVKEESVIEDEEELP